MRVRGTRFSSPHTYTDSHEEIIKSVIIKVDYTEGKVRGQDYNGR